MAWRAPFVCTRRTDPAERARTGAGRGRAGRARRHRSGASAPAPFGGEFAGTFGPTPTPMLPQASLTRFPDDPLAATRRGAGRGGRVRTRIVRRTGHPRVDPGWCGPFRRRRSRPAGPSRPLVLPTAALARESGRPTPRDGARARSGSGPRPASRAASAASSWASHGVGLRPRVAWMSVVGNRVGCADGRAFPVNTRSPGRPRTPARRVVSGEPSSRPAHRGSRP